jgi:drug/metabolite transporter (DMT)-like permease
VIAIVLSLTASLCWGIGDLIGGLTSRKAPAWTVTFTGQWVGLLAGGVVILGLGRPCLALGIGSVAYFTALSRGKMSVVAPIVATCAIVPVVWGVVRGDSLSLLQIAGIVASLVGVALASRESVDDSIPVGALEVATTGDRPTSGGRFSILLALVAAFLFGVVMVGFAVSAQYDPFYPPLVSRTVSAVLIGGVLAARRRPLVLPRTSAVPAVVTGLLHVTAALCFSVASTMGYLSVVSVLSSLQAVVMVGIAHAALRERLAALQLTGVILALGGALAIVAG